MKREKLLMTDIKTQNCSQSTRVDLLNMPCFRAHASAYYLCVYHLKAISPSLCELVLYYSKSNCLLTKRAELNIFVFKCVSCSSGFFKCLKMIKKKTVNKGSTS